MFIRAIKRLERSQEYSPQKFGKGPPDLGRGFLEDRGIER